MTLGVIRHAEIQTDTHVSTFIRARYGATADRNLVVLTVVPVTPEPPGPDPFVFAALIESLCSASVALVGLISQLTLLRLLGAQTALPDIETTEAIVPLFLFSVGHQ